LNSNCNPKIAAKAQLEKKLDEIGFSSLYAVFKVLNTATSEAISFFTSMADANSLKVL
jgi:hypothetical protein